MLKKILLSLASISSLTQAAELEITLTNATQGVYFTPVLLAAHSTPGELFRVGTQASSALEALAEGGSIDAANTNLLNASANIAEGAADAPGASDGPVAPGGSFTVTLTTDDNNPYLSLASLLLPTNDGFVGLDSWKIPETQGTYVINLNAYDAGTEANDELATSIPNAPFVTSFGTPGDSGAVTSGGTGITASGDENARVHIHRGNVGDLDTTGGASDIDASKHRWLNPVARLVITVQ
ncbi:MAG: spondin domain-containing protein [Cellvibrionales bacterium]|nr:spondin domain-containing protein [Cellvibrionales bacterium]